MSAPMTPNAELAYRVLDHIDAYPEQHDQAVWICRARDCGTAACLAGWACLLSGDQPKFYENDNETREVLIAGSTTERTLPERAAELLGIPYDPDRCYGHPLFNPHNTREDLGRLVEEIFGPRPGGES